jgi:hypothetical protein
LRSRGNSSEGSVERKVEISDADVRPRRAAVRETLTRTATGPVRAGKGIAAQEMTQERAAGVAMSGKLVIFSTAYSRKTS